MPKMPDETALGARPELRPRALPSASAQTAGYDRGVAIFARDAAQEGRGLGAFGESLMKAGDAIAAGEKRLQDKHDAVARARDRDAFTQAVQAELFRVTTEEDWGAPGTVENFRGFIDKTRSDILGDHAGSPESRLVLEARLQGISTEFAVNAAGQALAANDKLIEAQLGGTLNQLNDLAFEKPGALVETFRSWDAAIDDMAPTLSPAQERLWQQRGRERIAETAIGSLIMRGGAEAAEDALDIPGMSEVLGPEAQNRIRERIRQATQAMNDARNAGLAKRMEIAAVLGKTPEQLTEEDVLTYLGKAPKESTATVEIGDATSPTGTRIIPRSMVGQSLTPEALAKYPPGKPPSGMTIEQGPDGTLRITQGRGAGMSKKTEGTLENKLFEGKEGLARLDEVERGFKPEFQTFAERGTNWWNALREKAGADLDPDDKQRLTEFSTFRRDAIDNINRYIKEITGAQMSEKEADRIRKGMPDPGETVFSGDSPTEFQAKMRGTIRSLRLAVARYHWALKKGLDPLKTDISLDGMKKVMSDRINEIEEEVRAGNPTMSDKDVNDLVEQKAREEFGLS